MPRTNDVKRVSALIKQANAALARTLEILVISNQNGQQFDYTIVDSGSIGLDHLLRLVGKIEKLYFQE